MGTLDKDLQMGKGRETLTGVGRQGWEGDWPGKAGPGLCWGGAAQDACAGGA